LPSQSYHSYDNVKKQSPDVCGVYIDLTGVDAAGVVANPEFEVTIPVKINLHQILLLASFRYLPSFCGRWELELYPNWNNIVVIPCDTEFVSSPSEWSRIRDEAGAAPPWTKVTDHFVQIGQPFTMLDKVTFVDGGPGGTANIHYLTATVGGGPPGVVTIPAAAGELACANAASGAATTLTGLVAADATFALASTAGAATTVVVEDQVLRCNEATMISCLMNLTTFQLRYEVFEGLRQMYAEQPLIIPTNVLHYARFSGQPAAGMPDTFHATLSQCLENCDSVFILVPNNNNQTTCFYQPYLDNVRMSLGEFGIHPGNYVNTYGDPRFVAMALDALNLETSEITAMNRDVARSLSSPQAHYVTTGVAGGVTKNWVRQYGDDSNFFIGISLSQVGFQSGTVSSPNTNIPFIFDANVKASPLPGGAPGTFETSIIAMFLLDCALMIQVVPNSDIPVVKLTSKSIV
jgi:hypothetical protein